MQHLGIYVHFPYCDVKCAYCDFYSIAKRKIDNNFYENYIEHLKQDFIEKTKLISQNIKVVSIFFGGGTPSKVPPQYIASIIDFFKNNIKYRNNLEITIEVNPESLTYANLVEYKKAGINRIHAGIQTTNSQLLHYLGRLYHTESYTTIFSKIKDAGFSNFGCDFIYGIPHQKFLDLKQDITWAISEGVKHISAYCLTIEPNTHLERQIITRQKVKPSLRRGSLHYKFVIDLLKTNNFNRYEVSNFSLPKFASKHNLGYWKYRPYIGVGVAAHSFLGNYRLSAERDLNRYMLGNYYQIDANKVIPDLFIGIVRLLSYQSFSFIKKNIGEYNFTLFFNILKEIQKNNYVDIFEKGFKFTEKGIMFSDTILSHLIDADYIPVEPKPLEPLSVVDGL